MMLARNNIKIFAAACPARTMPFPSAWRSFILQMSLPVRVRSHYIIHNHRGLRRRKQRYKIPPTRARHAILLRDDASDVTEQRLEVW